MRSGKAANNLKEEDMDGVTLIRAVSGILFALLCVYIPLALATIAKKTNTGHGWWAWIPILNIVLTFKIARKPVWWIVLPFITYFVLYPGSQLSLFVTCTTSLVLLAVVWMNIAKARHRFKWLGLFVLIPIVGLPVVLGYLAWSSSSCQGKDEKTPMMAQANSSTLQWMIDRKQ